MAEEQAPQQAPEPAPENPTATAPAAAAPPNPAQEAPLAQQAPPEHRASEPSEAKEEDGARSVLGNVLLFGRYDVSGVTVRDAGIARYIDISPVAVPHTGGKHTNKPFAKAKMSIVERLINNMMRTEDFTGKKTKAYKAVERAFKIIEERTNQNPLQQFVDALQNAAPREEVTRLQYGGISVPKAVDVAPSRRVDLALRFICSGALEASHGSKESIEECLAKEIIAAAKNDVNCHSIAKKEEVERVAASAR